MSDLFFQPDVAGIDLFFTPDFSAAELAERRHRLAVEIGAGTHVLVPGAPPVATDFPTQDANFYYLCGLETVHSYLLIDGGSGRTRLFLPSRDTLEGEPQNRLGFEDAALIGDRLGLREVAPTTQLTAALAGVKTLYLPQAEVEGGGATRFGANGCAKKRAQEEWDSFEPRHQRITRMLTQRFPGVEVRDAGPLISALRTIKSPAEIAIMRKAGQLSAAAVMECMKITRPGVNENTLKATVEYVFSRRGRCGLGYGVIAAGGQRTWDGHYHLNNATLGAEEILLLDCGPDLRHYTSDIARLWPVNGTFSPWHRRVYGFITEYHKALLSVIRPGLIPAEVYRQANRRMAVLCEQPGTPYHDMQGIFENMVKRGVGYLNHGVGLSVHDAIGPWRDQPLREGFVCALDPMVWCEPQRQYIRVEDTIVVTAEGCDRLTGEAPFAIDEIEAFLRRGDRPAEL